MNINLSYYQIHYIYIKEVNVANHFSKLFPTPINTYKYITGTLNKGQPLERGEEEERKGKG
jgi:hypothetical protein